MCEVVLKKPYTLQRSCENSFKRLRVMLTWILVVLVAQRYRFHLTRRKWRVQSLGAKPKICIGWFVPFRPSNVSIKCHKNYLISTFHSEPVRLSGQGKQNWGIRLPIHTKGIDHRWWQTGQVCFYSFKICLDKTFISYRINSLMQWRLVGHIVVRM